MARRESLWRQVEEWLKRVRCQDYTGSFREHAIDGVALAGLYRLGAGPRHLQVVSSSCGGNSSDTTTTNTCTSNSGGKLLSSGGGAIKQRRRSGARGRTWIAGRGGPSSRGRREQPQGSRWF